MSLERLLIKAVCTTTMLFLIFSVCTCETIPARSVPFSATGGCDTPVFGPLNGRLEHTDGKYIDDYSTEIMVEDFIAEATFSNPYSISEGRWDYGFLFRLVGKEFHAIQIAYDGTWRHILFKEDIPSEKEEKWTIITEGNVSLRTGTNQSNHLRIIVIGKSGAFYVNGQFIAALDTSELAQKGDVRAATGINTPYKVPGKATQFEDFTVWSLDIPNSGPLSGSLEDKKDGSIEAFSADVNVEDFIAEATFSNPYSSSEGKWDYGFLFRRVTEDTSYAVRVTSDGTWSHAVRFGGDWFTIEEDTLSLRTEADQSNHLRIIVIGNKGWFYVNDQFIAALDTSGLTQSGDVRAATGILIENEIEYKSTQFEDFTVWSLDGCPELPKYIPHDKDNDGVIDDKDECDNPGCDIVDENGCPTDTDLDGVIDCTDECDYQEGLASNNGCPIDKDNDGVTDDNDNCYNPDCDEVDADGCPTDSDSDGVIDCVDECPSDYGEPKYDGCPDTDMDGVPDHQDTCNDPECTIVDTNGCPIDSDSDDVADCVDECQTQPGPAFNNGCPLPLYMYAIPVIVAIIIIAIALVVQKRQKGQKKKLEEKTVKEKPGKIICPFCKNEIEEDWVSCPYCGIKLKEDTQAY